MRRLFQDLLNSFTSDDVEKNTINLDHATAALLVEVMAADHELDDTESKTIKTILAKQFSLNSEQAEALLSQSTESHQEANDLYQFSKVITDHLSHDQRYDMLVNLWKVAYADRQIDRYEEHMIRKIADLLYMPHSQFMRAKHEANPDN